MRLDRDAALALEIHAVEHLRLHLARLQRAGHLEKTVGQRRLAVVDVRDDGEVPDVPWIHVRGIVDYTVAGDGLQDRLQTDGGDGGNGTSFNSENRSNGGSLPVTTLQPMPARPWAGPSGID